MFCIFRVKYNLQMYKSLCIRSKIEEFIYFRIEKEGFIYTLEAKEKKQHKVKATELTQI